MPDQWQLLIGNFAVVALVISAWANGRFLFEYRSRRDQDLIFGVVIGLGAMVSMMLAVRLNGAFIDLRLSLLGVAGFFGGPFAAVAAVAIAIGYRSFLGGPVLPSAIMTMVGAVLVGIVLSKLTRKRIPARYSVGLLAVG